MADDEVRGVPTERQLLVRAAALVGFAVVVLLLLSALPGLGEVRERLGGAEPAWIAATAAFAFASVVSYTVALRGTLEHLMPWRAAWNLGVAEQSGNVLLPTGGVSGPALGALLMRRAGVPEVVATTRSAALFLLTSATSFAALVVFGTLTWLDVLPGSPGWVGTLLPAAVAAVVLVGAAALARLPDGPAPEGASRLRGRAHAARAQLVVAVRMSLRLLRRGDPLLLLGLLGYLGFDVAALATAYHAFGDAGPSLGAFVLAYILGQAGSLIPTPGGIGGTDGGLIGMSIAYGASGPLAVAAVLAYRLFQLGFPIVLGVVAFARIRRRFRDGPPPEEIAARYAVLVEP